MEGWSGERTRMRGTSLWQLALIHCLEELRIRVMATGMGIETFSGVELTRFLTSYVRESEQLQRITSIFFLCEGWVSVPCREPRD